MSFNGKYPPGLFPRDLVAEWRFHPSEQLADSTYNNLDLTNANTVINSDNQNDGFNSTFNGTTSILSCAANTKHDDMEPFTVEGFSTAVGLGESSLGRIICKSEEAPGSAGNWRIGTLATATIAFVKDYATTDLNVTASDNSIVLGTKFHFAISWDGSATAGNVHIYVNGAETTYKTTTSGVGDKNSDAGGVLRIGGNGDADRCYNGTIGPIRIWKKVLTPTQIGWMYQRFR